LVFPRSSVSSVSLTLPTQVRRAFTGPAWHGDAIAELLHDVTAAEAATRHSPAHHTIAELAGHVGVWVDVARRRIAGEPVVARTVENFAPLDTSSDAAWQAALARLGERHEALARTAAALDDRRLHTLVPGYDHTPAEMLHGVIAHAAYHGGQMALVRNLIRALR
jgi:uncharacterized damage-inducible protein DinB